MMDSVSHVKSETKTQALGGFLWEELMGTISLQASTPPPQARSGSCCGWIWMLQTVENKTGPRPDCRRGVGGGWGKHFFQKKKKEKKKKCVRTVLSDVKQVKSHFLDDLLKKTCPFGPSPLCLGVCCSASQTVAHPACIGFFVVCSEPS